MSKMRRQSVIKRLIMENDIHNQTDLLEMLEKEDIKTTQATVSRDIRELNIIKIEDSDGKAYYRLLNSSVLGYKKRSIEERLAEVMIESGVSLTQVEFVNLLTVIPGYGNAVGILIDEVRETEKLIAGCVAGDDTILIVSKNKEDSRQVYRYLQQYMFTTHWLCMYTHTTILVSEEKS